MIEICKDCHFALDNDENTIICRRFPPKITHAENNRVSSHNPILTNSWWCGEFKRRVNGMDVRNPNIPTIHSQPKRSRK